MGIALLVGFFGLIVGFVFIFKSIIDKSGDKIISGESKVDSGFSKKHYDVDVSKYGGLLFNIGLALSLAATLAVFEWKSYEDIGLASLVSAQDDADETIDIPITEQPPPPPPKVIQQPEIIEVPDEQEIEDEIEIELDIEVDEEQAVEEIVQVEEEEEEEDVDQIFTIVENPAEPVGGYPKFYKFIKKKLKYPKQARRMGVEGKVYVQFIIDKTGAITNVKVMKGVGAGCDEEALRVIKMAPKWKAGKQRGRAVKQRIVVPIVFKLG